jgi:hypothetical protein
MSVSLIVDAPERVLSDGAVASVDVDGLAAASAPAAPAPARTSAAETATISIRFMLVLRSDVCDRTIHDKQ